MRSVLLPTPRRLQLLLQAKLGAIISVAVAFGAVGAVALRSADAAGLLGSSLSLLVIVYTAIVGSGVVAADMGDGPAQLWLQRPVRPVAFYLLRQAEAGCVALLLCVIVILAARVAAGWLGLRLDPDPLTLLPVHLVRCATIVALCFGVSSWIGRGNTVVVLALFVASVAIDSELVLIDSWISAAARAIVLPNEAVRALSRDLINGDGSSLIHLARIAGFFFVWLVIGAVGIWRATGRRGLTRGVLG